MRRLVPGRGRRRHETTLATWNRLDCAVTDAGVEGPPELVSDYDLSSWRRVLDVNLTGVFLGMKAELRAVLAGGWPSDGDAVMGCMILKRSFRAWGHQFLYNRQSLAALLRHCGFANAAFCEYGESDRENLRGLERHPRESVSISPEPVTARRRG